ncbi:MAG: tetratricopeptide repeat protein [Candidatus Marinimicrobia bacterium]|nr:tetratricopeptide repeat protein [Candidatus Neomarinimicrobiota bacterium]
MKLKSYLLLFACISAVGYSATRVTYTRPGTMMRIPTSLPERSPYLFQTGFGLEIHNFTELNTAKGIRFEAELGKNFLMGFSSAIGGDTTATANLAVSQVQIPVEFGFHLQQRIYAYNDISVSIGLQDIVFENQDSQGLSLNPNELSFFVVVGSKKPLGRYAMSTFLGFGSGGFAAADSVARPDSAGMTAGVFAGFLLNTPYFEKWGGMDFVGEFDGTGVNVGLRIPLTSDYRLSLGFTHIEKLPNWSSRYWKGHPAITFGLDMAVPKAPAGSRSGGGPSPRVDGQITLPGTNERFTQIDSTLQMADYTVHSLRDSMDMMNNEMRNLIIRLSAMEQHAKATEDSLMSMVLKTNVSESNMNEALRHLSRSLRYFYSGDYRRALQEVESALELNPNLALAYARRGSIYYKLGDIQRASIDWNLALRLDPEYDDVRNILKALHENRLKTTSIFEE